MITGLIKLFVALFVVLPFKLAVTGLRVGLGMVRVFFAMVTLPFRILL